MIASATSRSALLSAVLSLMVLVPNLSLVREGPTRRPAIRAVEAALAYPHVPGEIIVRFADETSEESRKEAIAAGDGVELQSFDEISAKLIEVHPDDLSLVLAELNVDPRVQYAEPNFLLSIDGLPNDPQYPLQWGLDNSGQIMDGQIGSVDADIDASEAWEVTTGSPGVIVAVIDTGVDFAHADLGGNNRDNSTMWTNSGELCPGCSTDGLDNDGNGYIDDWRGWDFVNYDDNPRDDNGHGSHVAGILGARANNSEGGAGIAYNTTIMALKAFTAGGGGAAGATVGAILYAAENGASIINASWGGITPSLTLEEAIVYAGEHGALFVAAGGNDGFDTDLIGHFPSALDLNNLIAVGATNNRDELSSFSNYGLKTVDIGAPGEDIYAPWVRTDLTSPYRYASGTSMAAPHVAGVAALIKARFPEATPLGIKNLILNSADRIENLVGLVSTGGRLNAGNALACPNEPQVWIDRPVPGFASVPGEPIEVRILASNCAVPDGVTVSANAGGQAIELAAQGAGLYTGTFTPAAPGALTINAQAQLGDRVDSHQITGESVLNYRFENDVFNWLDATAGTEIAFGGERDFEIPVLLSFPFTFYDRTFEEITIGENGLLGFGGTRVTNPFNQSIPDILAPNGFIAAYWDNLDLEAGGQIWHDVVGSAPNRRFVISWIDIPNVLQTSGPTAGSGPFDGITFQIILEESTNSIYLQYLDADFNANTIDYGIGATIGVEHFSGTIGRQFSYNDPSLRPYEATTAIRLSLQNPEQPEILTATLEDAAAGKPYIQHLSVEGGSPPYIWSIVEGSLPEGVGFDPATGTIAGTPYSPGAFSLTVQVTDSDGNAARQFLNFDVAAGYEWIDDEFSWIDASDGGERLPFERDDQAFTIELPFSFSYFDETFNQFQVSSNGYLVFGDDRATTFLNTNLPDPRDPNGTIAVLWDDLSPQDGGSVWMRLTGDAPNRRVVVSWNEVPRFKLHGGGTFQVVLEESTNDIVMQYLDLTFDDETYDLGASATIGIEDPDGTIGVEFSVDQTIPEKYIGQTAIRFTGGEPASPVMNVTSLQEGQLGAPYFDLLSARGGSPPFTWSIASGDLPPGLNLAPETGMLTGVPAATGSFTFAALATDSGDPSQSITSEYVLRILPGYEISDGAYEWINAIDGGIRLDFAGDDSAVSMSLPFVFNYYGESFEEVQVSTNGYLVFGGGKAVSLSNKSIPDPTEPNGMVAALWDDLSPDVGQGIWVRALGESPNRRFVVGWIDAARFNQVGASTFQITLEEGTNRIIFQYQDVFFDDIRYDYGASATVGLESVNGTIGTQFSFNQPVLGPYEGKQSLVFTPVE